MDGEIQEPGIELCLDNSKGAPYDGPPMIKQFLLIATFVPLFSCSWLRKDATIIVSNGTNYGERYFAARLIEKLKTVDGPSIKDPALLKTFKEALTEELIIEGALFSWARAHGVSFSDQELQRQLQDQVGQNSDLHADVSGAAPSMNLLRDTLYLQLIQKKLQTHLLSESPATDTELKLFFEKHKTLFDKPKVQFRQIVLNTEDEAKTLLQHLRDNKLSFEDAEKKFSLIREYKPDAEIPFYDATGNGLVPQLLGAPQGLQSRIYSLPSGFHLIKILQIKKNTNQSFDALRPSVLTVYNQKRANDLYLQWLRDHVKTKSVIIDHARLLALKAEYQESF